jgi:hypothetical protein
VSRANRALVGMALGALLALGGAGCRGRSAAVEQRERYGIEPLSIRVSAAGYMLDFRYRIVDAEKAKAIVDRRITPVLIDEGSGARLIVPTPPKVGALRTSSAPKAERVYFAMFANPGRLLKRGAKVTVEMVALRIQHLVVQ